LNPETIGDLRGKRVLVYSMGIEGRDLAAWMLRRGAEVEMSDTRTEAQLAAAGGGAPQGASATHTGGPLLSPEGFDLLAVSQSVLRHSNEVVQAGRVGIPVVSQMQLFLDLCKAKVCGISGSNGKSTTTALVGAMAKAAGIEHTVGGNIGVPLLAQVDDLAVGSIVILEISHTQLQYTMRSPQVATLTNVTPNHLDQFPWDEYVGLKRNLVAHQRDSDIAILNAEDAVSRGFAGDCRAQLRWSGRCDAPRSDGAFLRGDSVVVRADGRESGLFARTVIRLRGEHNLANVLSACATASALGIGVEAMAEAVLSFRGVAHRLQVLGRARGATWVDDSIATSPERTIAGIRAFDEPVVLLLGGREKNLPLEGLREEIRRRARGIVCFGESGGVFRSALAQAAPQAALVGNLGQAVEAAAGMVREGDAVLLSPAGTSFDAYPNFEARGDAFAKLVEALPGFEREVEQ
jgi:UDP-N-acetylmuramoylalanine--D-glutamate ligase